MGLFEGFSPFGSFVSFCVVSSSEFFFRFCPLLGSWIVFAFLFGLSPLRFGRVRSQPLRLPFFGLHLGLLLAPFLPRLPLFLLCLSLLPMAYFLSHRSRGECRGFPRLFRVLFSLASCGRLGSSRLPLSSSLRKKNQYRGMQPCPFFGSKGVR